MLGRIDKLHTVEGNVRLVVGYLSESANPGRPGKLAVVPCNGKYDITC